MLEFIEIAVKLLVDKLMK